MNPGGEALGSVLAGSKRGRTSSYKTKARNCGNVIDFNQSYRTAQGPSAADPDSPPSQAVTRCDADPAQPSSENRGRHDVRGPSACVLRRAAALPQLGLQRDLRDARQRLRERAVTLHGVRDLLELCLVDAGHRGLHRQRDPVDHESCALFGQAHAGLRVDIATGQPRLVAGERKRHRETRGVRRAQDFLGVGAAAVVLEAAREAVRIVLQRAGLGADLSQSLLALAFPVNACGLFVPVRAAAATAPATTAAHDTAGLSSMALEISTASIVSMTINAPSDECPYPIRL